MITTGKELCPYFGEEQRKEWHRERGLDDPQKTSVEAEEVLVERVPPPYPPVVKLKEEGKHAAYRERNKAKLAEKARARRAKRS